MKVFRTILAFVFLWRFAALNAYAATVTTSGSGSWSSTTPNAPWPGGTIPATTDDIVVGNGFTLTVDGNRTCASLAFASAAGTLSVNSAVILTVTNAVSMNSLVASSTAGTISGLGTINCASLNVGTAVTPTANSLTAILTSSIAAFNVSGNVTLTATANGGSKKVDPSLLIGSGTLDVNGVISTVNAAAGNTSVVSMNTGGGTGVLDLSHAAPFSISGTGTSTINLNGSGTTVIYSGAAQTAYATAYKNLTLSGSGIKTLTGIGTVNGDLTFQGTASATAATNMTIGGHLTLGTGTAFNGSTFTNTVGGNLSLSGTASCTGNINTITGDLILSAAASFTAANALAITGNVSLASGTTFNASTFAHTVGGNWTNNGGTFNPSTGTVTFNTTSAKALGGTASTTFYNLALEGGSLTLPAGMTYSCTALLLGTTVVSNLIFNSNSVLYVSGNVTLGAGGANRGNMDMTNGGYLKCNTISNWNSIYTYGIGTVEVTGTMAGFSPSGFGDWYNLILSGSANVTCNAATVYVHGDLTLKTGTSWTSGPNYLQLDRDWTIQTGATFVPGASNQAYVAFLGANTQHIYGSVSLYRLWANKTSNNQIIIDGDVSIADGIWWDQGIFGFTGAGKLVLADGYSDLGQAMNAIRCSAAPIKKIGDDAFTFPVCAGDGTRYNPLTISDPGTDVAAAFTATYTFADPDLPGYTTTSLGAGLDHVSQVEYWTLDETGSGSPSVSVKLQWGSWSAVTNLTDLRVAKWSGTQWTNQGNTVTTGNASLGTVTSTVVTTFSPFTLASATTANPLPVELLSFQAVPLGNQVDISWVTASEKNCDFFVVERSADGNSFENVATVNGAGNTSLQHAYEATDLDPYNGISYYRLRQVDFNGSSFYSNLVQVEFNAGENVLNVYPSVSAGDFTFSYSGKINNEVFVHIRNVLGEDVHSQEFIMGKELHVQQINLSEKIPAGVYFVTAESGENIRVKRIVIR